MTLGEAFPSTLAAARQGADWAWAALYRDLVGPVTGYLTGHGGKEPEDLAAETFLQVARGIRAFNGDERSFRSWVFVIAHRRLQDERRRDGRRPTTVSVDDAAAAPAVGALPARSDVEREAIESLSSAEALAILNRLTAEQRDVLWLRIVTGLSLEETAATVGKRVGAVKALQRRGLQALHEEMFPGA